MLEIILFSVIIPVYKTENYLTRCMESVIGQTYSNLEIILVDDGSPAPCPQLCDKWSQKDKRIKVIHKENGGLGFARNSGMDHATGNYISFVDSDDYIAPDAYAKLAEKLVAEGYPDICLFDHAIQRTGTSVQFGNQKFPDRLNEKEIFTKLAPKAFGMSLRLPLDSYGIGSAWGAVYRRDFVQDAALRFKSEREYLCEDLIFSEEVCVHAKSAVFLSDSIYFYCENETSLTHSYRKDRFDKSERLYRYMASFAQSKGLGTEAVLRAEDCFLSNIIVCLKQEVNNRASTNKTKLNNISIVCRSKTLQNVLNEHPINHLPFSKKYLMLKIQQQKILCIFLLTVLHSRYKRNL